jgi:hypothetical protein
MEMAGAPVTGGIDGVSQLRLLASAEGRARQLFWHIPHYTNQGSRPAGAVRDGKWKLVEHYDDGKVELFDLSADVSETRDLSLSERDRTATLRNQLRAWRQSMDAQENTPNPAVDETLYRQIYVEFDSTRFDPLRADDAGWKNAAAWRQRMDAAVRKGK